MFRRMVWSNYTLKCLDWVIKCLLIPHHTVVINMYIRLCESRQINLMKNNDPLCSDYILYVYKNNLFLKKFPTRYHGFNYNLFWNNFGSETVNFVIRVYSIPGVANLRLFEGLSVALDKCTRIPFSCLRYYILKHYHRSVCVLKCLLITDYKYERLGATL